MNPISENRQMRRVSTAMIAVVMMFGGAMMFGGCETAKMAGVDYDMNTMSAKIPAPLNPVVEASQSTLEGYGVHINNVDRSADAASIDGKQSDGSPVTVHMKRISDSQTELKLDAGGYEKSLGLVKGIYDNLGLVMPK